MSLGGGGLAGLYHHFWGFWSLLRLYVFPKILSTLLSMGSTSKSCRCCEGRYFVVVLPNGICFTHGQHTEEKSVHTFPLKDKDRKRHQAWVRFVRRHRPKWSSLFFTLTIVMRAALRRIGKSLPNLEWNGSESQMLSLPLIFRSQIQQIPLLSHW